MTDCTCITEARGVDVRTADYIAKERADAKWRAEKLGWVVLSTEEYDEIETLRIQLAACSVAALANTRYSAAQRIGRGNPYWSASYQDVCDAVDREMALRERSTEPAVAAAEA